MPYSKEKLQKIWEKGYPVEGKDPDLYRKDRFGTPMYRHSYGETSVMGWEVDHSKPRASGGTDNLNNLQPMHWSNNRSKGDSY